LFPVTQFPGVGPGSRTLMEAPTVAAMAEVIVRSLAGGMDKDTLGQMLAELEVLSEEEARSLLNREPS